MIKDLDLTLKELLSSEAESGSVLAEATISFSVPNEKWQQKGSGLDLNAYLYDIRENRKLRTNERQHQRNSDGTITIKSPPPRIDCAYLITAWNKATDPGEEEKELQEHRLLSQVLQVLLRNPTIPSGHLQGALTGQKPPLPLIAAQQDGLPDPVEFWNALGSPLKPSINCVITISLDLKQKTKPLDVVTSRITKLNAVEEVIQIGGRVLNKAKPPEGICDAEVMIPELQKKTKTDANGFYTFINLPRGKLAFKVRATGYRSEQVTIEIPAPTGTNYDIQLSPSS